MRRCGQILAGEYHQTQLCPDLGTRTSRAFLRLSVETLPHRDGRPSPNDPSHVARFAFMILHEEDLGGGILRIHFRHEAGLVDFARDRGAGVRAAGGLARREAAAFRRRGERLVRRSDDGAGLSTTTTRRISTARCTSTCSFSRRRSSAGTCGRCACPGADQRGVRGAGAGVSRHSSATRVCHIAALAMAVSPAFVFYGRYAIHETELLFFLMLAAWGLARAVRRRHAATPLGGGARAHRAAS